MRLGSYHHNGRSVRGVYVQTMLFNVGESVEHIMVEDRVSYTDILMELIYEDQQPHWLKLGQIPVQVLIECICSQCALHISLLYFLYISKR